MPIATWPTQVPLDRCVAQLDVTLRVGSCRRPAAFNSRHITAPARAGVLPPLPVHILAPAEQLSDQPDLLARRPIKTHRRPRGLRRVVRGTQPLGEQRAQPLVLGPKPLQLERLPPQPLREVGIGRRGRCRLESGHRALPIACFRSDLRERGMRVAAEPPPVGGDDLAELGGRAEGKVSERNLEPLVISLAHREQAAPCVRPAVDRAYARRPECRSPRRARQAGSAQACCAGSGQARTRKARGAHGSARPCSRPCSSQRRDVRRARRRGGAEFATCRRGS